VSDIYQDGRYAAMNPGWHAEDSAWKCGQIMRMVRAAGLQPRTVCDVGCGAGEILAQLRERLPSAERLDGYDISPHAIELCRPRELANLRFHLGDFTAAAGGPFDLLLAMDVIEHVEDCFGFLRKLRDRAEYKMFHIPLDICVPTVLLDYFVTTRRRYGHIHSFTRRSALSTLEETGYHVLRHFHTANSLRPSNRLLRDKVLWLPRKVLSRINPDWTHRLLGGFSLMVLAR
jgi:predicted TPR repeat methyltransferase